MNNSDETNSSSNWIAEVSHELRLPIANIKLLIETLLDGAMDDNEACKRMLKRAYQEVDRLNILVSNLLSHEKVAEERSELNRKWILLKEPTQYALDSVSQLAKSKNIDIVVDIKNGCSIYANPEQLDQILLNLLENAVKFTDKGGRIVIKSEDAPGKFSVVDTGIGIAPEEIPKIFQRFYRINPEQHKGSTGLGLSIVKHILDLHEATIQITSEQNKGSTFSLQFPNPN
jgi:two-component system phosphate regulon sensor histidine kinase PhoR